MRTRDPSYERSVRRKRGEVAAKRAGSRGPKLLDASGGDVTAPDIQFIGATVSGDDDELAIVTITGSGQQATTDVDLEYGDVVVLQSDGTITTTTLAKDTRPVGVVQIAATASNPVSAVFQGYVAQVNTTGTVNAGDYLETSATAGLAQANSTRRVGSFALALADGPNPPALLFGIPDAAGALGAAGGDLGGTYPNPIVTGLLGKAIQPWSDTLSFPPTQAELTSLLGLASTTGGLTFTVHDETLDLYWSVQSVGTLYVCDTMVRPLAGSGGGGSIPAARTLTSPPDGGWVWFIDPRAIQYGGYLYVGYIDSSGNVYVDVFDDATGARLTHYLMRAALEVDDHDNPSLYIRPDDHKLVVFWSKHLGNAVYDRISVTSLDTDPTLDDGMHGEDNFTLNESLGNRFFTYPNPVLTTNSDASGLNELWLFCRVHMGGTAAEWHYSVSSDGGESFGALQSGIRLHTVTYSRVVSDGVGTIHVAAAHHFSDPSPTKIYHLARSSSAWRDAAGSSIGTAPFDAADLPVVYDSGGDYVWVWDIALDGTGKPYITFVRFVSDTDHRYYYARWTGTDWDVHEITAAGGTIADTGVGGGPVESLYSGGVVLDHADPTVVYLSKVVGAQFEMFRYVTADGGATWSSTAVSTGSTSKQIRPVAVRDADTTAAVWLSGTYDNYADFSLGMKGLEP